MQLVGIQIYNVEFYSKNKFEKLVHMVGLIIRIYQDARSDGCQMNFSLQNVSSNTHIQNNMVIERISPCIQKKQ